MTRLLEGVSAEQVIEAMSDHHPGALVTCARILEYIEDEGLAILQKLDGEKIYGKRIWMIWQFVCYKRIERFVALLRCWLHEDQVDKYALERAILCDGRNLYWRKILSVSEKYCCVAPGRKKTVI